MPRRASRSASYSHDLFADPDAPRPDAERRDGDPPAPAAEVPAPHERGAARASARPSGAARAAASTAAPDAPPPRAPRRSRGARTAPGIDARPGADDASGDAPDESARREKALVVHERLCREYGCPIAFFHDLDPLSELLSSLLSHRTRNGDSGRAFRALRARYLADGAWTALRDAPTAEVEATIAGVTWPEQKAPRLQAVLRAVGERVGRLDEGALDFLAELPVPEARAWLEGIPGVGPKTSAAVLLFSRLRRPALPVDSHHHRVAVRLGLLAADVEVGPSHAVLAAQLPPEWDAQTVYDNHEALMLHGQRCCYFREPACTRCVVLDLCPTGQRRLGRGAAASVAPPPADGERAAAADGADLRERRLPPEARPPRPARGDDAPAAAGRGTRAHQASARREPQEHRMSDHDSQQSSKGPRGDRPGQSAQEDPQATIERMNAEVREQDARSAHPKASGDVNDPQHYRDGHAERAHGTHGKGFMDEQLVDEQAVDTGDDAQLRTAGGGGDQAPDPEKFKENSAGRMGGPGWGNEQAGGSSVDRRPRDGNA